MKSKKYHTETGYQSLEGWIKLAEVGMNCKILMHVRVPSSFGNILVN